MDRSINQSVNQVHRGHYVVPSLNSTACSCSRGRASNGSSALGNLGLPHGRFTLPRYIIPPHTQYCPCPYTTSQQHSLDLRALSGEGHVRAMHTFGRRHIDDLSFEFAGLPSNSGRSSTSRPRPSTICTGLPCAGRPPILFDFRFWHILAAVSSRRPSIG